MVKLLTALAALGVLSITITQVAIAQTTQDPPRDVDSPADRDLPLIPCFQLKGTQQYFPGDFTMASQGLRSITGEAV
jgi:hypothetical protein